MDQLKIKTREEAVRYITVGLVSDTHDAMEIAEMAGRIWDKFVTTGWRAELRADISHAILRSMIDLGIFLDGDGKFRQSQAIDSCGLGGEPLAYSMEECHGREDGFMCDLMSVIALRTSTDKFLYQHPDSRRYGINEMLTHIYNVLFIRPQDGVLRFDRMQRVGWTPGVRRGDGAVIPSGRPVLNTPDRRLRFLTQAENGAEIERPVYKVMAENIVFDLPKYMTIINELRGEFRDGVDNAKLLESLAKYGPEIVTVVVIILNPDWTSDDMWKMYADLANAYYADGTGQLRQTDNRRIPSYIPIRKRFNDRNPIQSLYESVRDIRLRDGLDLGREWAAAMESVLEDYLVRNPYRFYPTDYARDGKPGQDADTLRTRKQKARYDNLLKLGHVSATGEITIPMLTLDEWVCQYLYESRITADRGAIVDYLLTPDGNLGIRELFGTFVVTMMPSLYFNGEVVLTAEP